MSSSFKIFTLLFITLVTFLQFSEQVITTNDCGKAKGCLRVPAGCNGTDCNFLVTYTYKQDHVEFEMFGNDSSWVSIGFNEKQEMVNTDSVVCFVNNSVLIRSARLKEKTSPTMEEANDLNLTYNSTKDNSVQCRFTHPLRPANGSKLRALNDEVYLIYGTGIFSDNRLQYHQMRGASAYHVNFTKNEELRAASEALATDGCGKTIGCLRYPAGCNGTECQFMATYVFEENYVTFEMFGKDADWVAVGFSDNREMPDTDAVLCLNHSVVIRSSNISEKRRPPMEEATDLQLTGRSFFNDNIQCRFRHPYIPEAGSKLRNLSMDAFLLYAKGSLTAAGDEIDYHTSEQSHRGASQERIDFKTASNIEIEEPEEDKGGGIAADGCNKTMGCLRYPAGCSGTECQFMATYTFQENYVTFEMFGKDADWVAVGFSDDREMPDTDAVLCLTANNSVVIRSSKISEKRRPPLEEATDLQLNGTSFLSNNIQCRFRHPYIPEAGSKLRNLSRDAFLLYAKGKLTADEIDYHTSEESHRGASQERIDFKTASNSGKEEPDEDKGGIATDGCGETVGCLRHESGCNGGRCNFAATYSYEPSTKLITFEMFGKNAEWVAIGFSDDTKMPNTGAVFCYNLNSNILLRSAELVSRSLPSLKEGKDLKLLDGSMDGGIRCKFTYPLTPGNTSTLRRLDQEIYLLYAKGSVSSTPNQHSSLASARGASSERVNVTTTVESQATSPSKLKKKVHGSVMVIVWLLLASSGLFFARYTRDNWPNAQLLGTKVWFQFHRFFMITVVLGTIASIVVIFVDLEGFTEQDGNVKTHAIIGLVVLGLSVLQPIGAVLRPHPGAPKRPYFNFFHRSLGVSAFVLAIATIILGLDIFNKDKAYNTVIGYAVFLAVLLIVMDISKFFYEKKKETNDSDIIPGGMKMESNIASKTSFHLTLSQIFLGIVVVVSLVVTVVVIFYINDGDDEE